MLHTTFNYSQSLQLRHAEEKGRRTGEGWRRLVRCPTLFPMLLLWLTLADPTFNTKSVETQSKPSALAHCEILANTVQVIQWGLLKSVWPIPIPARYLPRVSNHCHLHWHHFLPWPHWLRSTRRRLLPRRYKRVPGRPEDHSYASSCRVGERVARENCGKFSSAAKEGNYWLVKSPQYTVPNFGGHAKQDSTNAAVPKDSVRFANLKLEIYKPPSQSNDSNRTLQSPHLW